MMNKDGNNDLDESEIAGRIFENAINYHKHYALNPAGRGIGLGGLVLTERERENWRGR